MPEVVVSLQAELRPELKEPLGDVYTDADALLADAGAPVLAVGDIVTYHLLEAGRVPDVALVDERTERTEVDEDVTAAIAGFDREVTVDNPPATITAGILQALGTAIASGESTLIRVDGEEDLAALPALLLAPPGASVVYGQPGEGMVLVPITEDTQARARDLLSRMTGDADALLSRIDER